MRAVIESELDLVGLVRGPVIMEGEAVVLGNAPAGSQFKRISAIVHPETELDRLADTQALLHFRHGTPGDRTFEDVPFHHKFGCAFDWPAILRSPRLSREEVLPHHSSPTG